MSSDQRHKLLGGQSERISIEAPSNLGIGTLRSTGCQIVILLQLEPNTHPTKILVQVCKDMGITQEELLTEWNERMCPKCGMGTNSHCKGCPDWKVSAGTAVGGGDVE